MSASADSAFTGRQLLLLLALTLVWGVNWPVMKLGVTGFPPLTFRALSLVLGLPVLYAIVRAFGLPLAVARRDWRELGLLTLGNMLVWNVLAMMSLQALSSGRAAILGYTMPIFSALCGTWFYGDRLSARQWAGVAAAAIGVGLLLWHELGVLAGRPWAVSAMLIAALVWAFGTQRLRRTRVALATLALAFWMTLLSAVVLALLAAIVESRQWHAPTTATWGAIVYNAVLIFGFAQPAWLLLARNIPPAASTLSVMMIPVLGALSGAWWLGETLHWQDGAALLLMGVAIGSVLWPARTAPAPSATAVVP